MGGSPAGTTPPYLVANLAASNAMQWKVKKKKTKVSNKPLLFLLTNHSPLASYDALSYKVWCQMLIKDHH